jgi:hypothetical protein
MRASRLSRENSVTLDVEFHAVIRLRSAEYGLRSVDEYKRQNRVGEQMESK